MTLQDVLATIKQDEIADQISAIEDEIRRAKAIISFHYTAIAALRGICTHPKTTTCAAMGKETWTECTACGKEL